MANVITDFYSEVKTAIKSLVSLPDPPTNMTNFWTSVQGARISIVDQLRAADARVILPFWVLDFGDFVPSDGEAMNQISVMRAPTTIICVQQLGPAGTQNTAYEQVNIVKQAFDAANANWTNFTVLEEGRLFSNVDAPVNAELLAESQVQVIAAALHYLPGLLVALDQ